MKKKIKILRDPIINCKNINDLKKEELNKEFNSIKYYIAIGRLTSQKNFNFLIDSFSKIHGELKIKNLIILGEGEQKVLLENLVKRYKMEKYIHLIGYKDNPYKYIYNSEALISTSNYEDPGFVIYESIFLNKAIISSNCDNGPKELNEYVKKGFFFQKDNITDFKEKILEFEKENNFQLKLHMKKFSKNFTIFSHNKTFSSLLG